MDDNPYASPRTENSLASKPEPPTPRRSAGEMIWIGARVGVWFGGFMGFVMGSVLGTFAYVAVSQSTPIPFAAIIVGPLLGSFCGVVLGLPIGAFLGAYAARARRRDIRRVGINGAIFVGVVWTAINAFVGSMLPAPPGFPVIAVCVVSCLVAAMIGVIGGLLLSVTLMVMSGDDPPDKRQHNASP